MPCMDGKGPYGRRLGRGLGPCGLALRRGYAASQSAPQSTKDEERRVLEAHLESLDSEKQRIEERLKAYA